MKIENQVCTLEQAKKLMALGVTAEPLYWHVIDIDPLTPMDIIQKWQHSNFDQCEKYPAYTVAELGVMLPPMFRTYHERNKGMWYCSIKDIGLKILKPKPKPVPQCLSTFWETTSPPLKK